MSDQSANPELSRAVENAYRVGYGETSSGAVVVHPGKAFERRTITMRLFRIPARRRIVHIPRTIRETLGV